MFSQIRANSSFLRIAFFILLFDFISCSAYAQEQDNDDALSAKSSVAGIEFVTLGHIPKAPGSAKSQKECGFLLVKPKTAGGRIVAALGWGLTAEVPFGAYDAVSFAGQFEPSSSGSCETREGNVAIFKDRQLIALAYATKGVKQTIGTISALRDGLRIWDGSLAATPVADIHFLDGYLFQIDPVADQDLVCAGQGKVPNIYGKPINTAREALMSDGWVPLKNPQDFAADKVQYARELALSQRGIVEVDSCSGTGAAFCKYFYRNGNMELSVTTSGDEDFPRVAGYETSCDKAQWHQSD